jgi:sec-independent protein translocase protein TatC
VSVQKGEMNILGHLEELRWRLIKSALAVVICAIPAGIYWKQILDIVMIYPLIGIEPKPKLIFTTPAEGVILSVQICIAAGVIMASPVIFYQAWRFVSPGLYKKEKWVILPAVIASSVFFISGILFCYYTFPLIMKFLVAYTGNRLDPMFKVNDYFGFLLKLSLSFGIIFELPVVSFVLSRIGLIDARFLIKHIRYAIVAIFVISALLTPPDIFSMCILATPLFGLYVISILVAFFAAKKRKKGEV